MSHNARKAKALGQWALLIACLAPLTVFIAVIATRTGLISLDTGLSLVALKIGPVLAWIGAGAALLSLLLLVRHRDLWFFVVASVLVSGVTLGVYQYQLARFGVAPRDVTTNFDDPPGFGRLMLSERRKVRAPASSPQACEGLEPIKSQLSPETVEWALRQSGITIMGVAPFRVDGWQEGMWFGIQHDVTVRIRPGLTDVRVSGRDNMPIGPQACDLAKRIVAEMNALR